MLIFLYGPDDYRRQQKKKELIAEFQKKHLSLGMDFFDLADSEKFPALKNFLRSQSIFEPFKLAIVENIGEGPIKELAEELKAAVKKDETIVLISERERPDKPLDFLARKSSRILVQPFNYLKGKDWEKFVAWEAEKQGLNLTASALRFLAKVYVGDTWRLVTELQKIGLLGKTAVSFKDFENLDLELRPDFWNLLNSMRDYDLAERLFGLAKLLAWNEPLPKIFNILASVWSEKLGAFAGADLAVKSGKLDYEEALLDLVIS